MEIRTSKVILAIILIAVSFIITILALISYSRHTTAGLWVLPIAAICTFSLGTITLVFTLRNNKKSSAPDNMTPPQK